MYTNSIAKVFSPDGETEMFSLKTCILQGDTLAPYLFVIAFGYALWKAINGHEEELGFTIHPRWRRRVGPVMITNLDFADYITLLSDSVNQAQELL